MKTGSAPHKRVLVMIEELIFKQFPTESKMEQNEKEHVCG